MNAAQETALATLLDVAKAPFKLPSTTPLDKSSGNNNSWLRIFKKEKP